jgi:hypothetical protein
MSIFHLFKKGVLVFGFVSLQVKAKAGFSFKSVQGKDLLVKEILLGTEVQL